MFGHGPTFGPGGDRLLFDEVVRVPLLVKPAQGDFARGIVVDAQVQNFDLMPTLLELAGCQQLPEQTLDGQSLVPLIRGAKQSLSRPFLAWWYPHSNGHGTHPSQAILKDGWKLIHFMEENETELYNLVRDEGERNNLAKVEPERTRELLATLNEWVEETRVRKSN